MDNQKSQELQPEGWASGYIGSPSYQDSFGPIYLDMYQEPKVFPTPDYIASWLVEAQKIIAERGNQRATPHERRCITTNVD